MMKINFLQMVGMMMDITGFSLKTVKNIQEKLLMKMVKCNFQTESMQIVI